MLAPRVDNRLYFAPLLAALIVLAWLALLVWGESPYSSFLDHGQFAEIELGLNWNTAGLMAVFVTGWTVMTIAMMLPTSLPLVTLFRRLVRRRQDSGLLVALLIAGYLATWSFFGLVAHLGDAGLHASVNRWHWLDDNSQLIAGSTLLFAGVYQFTPLKYACLDKCRSPLAFITEHWHGSNERLEAFKLGIHHGIFCVGCCWSLMLLMFAVGIGNVAWMLVLGGVMAVEKNVSWGRSLSAPLGVALVIAGIAVLALGGPAACAHTGSSCV
jgi:predicted metal-binding membrane protein